MLKTTYPNPVEHQATYHVENNMAKIRVNIGQRMKPILKSHAINNSMVNRDLQVKDMHELKLDELGK
ncbi:MAG: hypothetical protein ABS965_02285, partial [Succiniclasticum sp.]